jgi:hypothetical protein
MLRRYVCPTTGRAFQLKRVQRAKDGRLWIACSLCATPFDWHPEPREVSE